MGSLASHFAPGHPKVFKTLMLIFRGIRRLAGYPREKRRSLPKATAPGVLIPMYCKKWAACAMFPFHPQAS